MGRQPRAAVTRQKLVDAAARLFADNGYLDTTPREIAAAADLTTGAFYYHFSSKEEIAGAIIDQGWPNVALVMTADANPPESGIENVIAAEFALVDVVNRDKLQRIGFHLNMAIWQLGPAARRAYRARMESFASVVPAALRPSELRDGVSREQAGELLWIASTGAQLMSDALEETGSILFGRLGMAWKSALRTIVVDEMLSQIEEFVDATVSQYGGVNVEEPVEAVGQVA